MALQACVRMTGSTALSVREETARIEAALRPYADPGRARQEKRYLKSRLDFMGVGVPATRRVVKGWLRSRAGLAREDLLRLVRALWRRRVHELRLSAIELLRARERLLLPGDMERLESMVRTAVTWAYVDALACYVVAPLAQRYPELAAAIDGWAEDDDFWIRRAALLALLPPLRRGDGDWDRFVRYADRMLEEREFFIRKAIGWVLRDVGKVRPDLVRDFLSACLPRVSSVTLREAVKYLPDSAREELLRRRSKD